MSAEPRAWESWETPPGVPEKSLLHVLVADAAGRAAAMLEGTTLESEDPLIDAVRLLASAPGRSAQLPGIAEDDLRRLIVAYRHGGTAGVSAALEATPCGPDELSEAVDEVHRRRTFAIGELSVEAGSITDDGAGVRLRRGPDGQWYPFTFARKQWWPAAGASPSAGGAYQAAVRARSVRRANG